MKVKSMKKALSLFCAGAMIATSFAVVNFDTVKAAGWNSNTVASLAGMSKVPFSVLSASATNYAPSEGGSANGARPGTGHYDNLVDGKTTSYYHSNYDGNNQPTNSNGELNGNNVITLTFKGDQKRNVSGIALNPRQGAAGNGRVTEFEVNVVQVQNNIEKTTQVKFKNDNTARAKISYSTEEFAEKVFEFDKTYENVSKIEVVIKKSLGYQENKFICISELSVLQPIAYSAEGIYNVEDFKCGETGFAPSAPDGKLFAGWVDKTTNEPYTQTTGQAKAKFVDAKILGSGAQLLATKDSYSDKTNIRFMSSVDSLNYKNVGFLFELDGEKSKIEHISREVYSELKAMNGTEVLNYKPTMFSTESKYFFAGTLKNVPVAAFDKLITATPFWITKDGAKVFGTPKRITINQADNAQYLNTVKYTTNDSNQINGLDKDSDKNWVNLGEAAIQSTLTINGAWDEWPRNTDQNQNKGAFSELGSNGQWILGQKYEIENGDGSASLVYPFEGTGIALYIQKFDSNNGGFDVEVLDENGNSIGKTIKHVDVDGNGQGDKCFVYSARGLTRGKYQLKLTNCRGKVSVDAVYVVDRVVPEAQPQQ